MSSVDSLAAVVLFDIDGTLLTGGPDKPSAGVRAMNEAALVLTGIDSLYRLVEFAGRTDRQIARDLLAAAGQPDPELAQVTALVQRYTELLEQGVRQRPYVPLPGVRQTIGALRMRQVLVGLGTGNVRRGAVAKLRSAGYLELFDVALGGYGDDAETRAEVLRTGARRCDDSGELRVIIVGDTPHDIRAAHDIDALCVGVPTGSYDEAALRGAGADAVVPMLDPGLVDVIRRLL